MYPLTRWDSTELPELREGLRFYFVGTNIYLLYPMAIWYSTQRGKKKRVLVTPKLELQSDVSCDVGVGN